jgi:hypothetical protein
MATRYMSILGAEWLPNASGVYVAAYSQFATNDVWNATVVVFPDSGTRDGIAGRFIVPSWFVSSPEIVVVWTSTVTTGNVVWDFDYRAVGGDNVEPLDQTGNQEALTVTDAAPGAAHRRLAVAMNMTAANLATQDEVEFELFRDVANASDTMAASALLFRLYSALRTCRDGPELPRLWPGTGR